MMGASAIDYVGGSGDEALALLEQIVGAGRECIERTSRHGENLVPCSPANRAVINEPDRSAASITTTASEIPEISRLRREKSLPRGAKPGERSLRRRPADILGPDQAKPREALAAVEPDLCSRLVRVLGVTLANPRLLAFHQPPDIRGVADIEKNGEQQEQCG